MTNLAIRISPPEGVPISFRIATGGQRFGAQLLDILITFGGMFLFFLAMIWSGIFDWSLIATLFLLLVFFLRVPYYIFSELVWNGRTIGKRIVKIRVVSADGGRLTPHQITARNLMKEVEVFMPATTILSATVESGWVTFALVIWMLLVLLVPLFNKKRQRLGDMIAGTYVIDQPQSVLLPDLAANGTSQAAGFVFDTVHLEVYGRYELQVLEEILRQKPRTPEAVTRMEDVSKTIQRKIGYAEKVAQGDNWDFLSDFYRQQRQYLESRQLFGDAREDKYHEKTKEPE